MTTPHHTNPNDPRPQQSRRRSPAHHERQRDPERTKQRILDAAIEEFSAKGFAGARVAAITRSRTEPMAPETGHHTTRVEAFSDGVFAVAITLLALSIATFTPEHGPLLHQIAEQWTSFAAYLVSFFTIGVIWINHHALFAYIRQVDRLLMFLNLVLLAVVVLIPLATATMATFLRAGGPQARIAVALYGLVLEATGIPWAVLVAWSVHRGYLHQVTTAAHARVARLRSALGALLYLLGAGVALLSAELALGLYAAIVVYYFLVEQRAARPTSGTPTTAAPSTAHDGGPTPPSPLTG